MSGVLCDELDAGILPYDWPSSAKWRRMTPIERKHKALRQAVKNERRGKDSAAAHGFMSPAVRQALALADGAFWTDGEVPRWATEPRDSAT